MNHLISDWPDAYCTSYIDFSRTSSCCSTDTTRSGKQLEGSKHFDRGWAMADDIRNAWSRLEKGLLYVSDLLLTSTEQSSCGTSAWYAIRDQPHWPHPEDYGYRDLHQSPQAAQCSFRRTHLAFQLLIAQCSLAIALWLFPGPRDGHIPDARTTHYNMGRDESVPDWVAFLRKKDVLTSWINTITDSIITNFSIPSKALSNSAFEEFRQTSESLIR